MPRAGLGLGWGRELAASMWNKFRGFFLLRPKVGSFGIFDLGPFRPADRRSLPPT
jgi:hypothetical protein